MTFLHRDMLPIPAPDEGRAGQAVLASATGCDLAEIAPFVRSLRAVFAGRIILIVERKPTLLAWLSTHGVEAVVAADRLLHWKPHPAVARFAVFAQLLQERRDIRQALVADIRTVVFQADPFRRPMDGLEFFTGAGGATPSASEMRVLETLMGQDLARDLGRRSRIADVVAGPSEAVLRFCRTVLLLCDRSRAGAGLDQAASHVVAHLGLAGGRIRPNFQRAAIASCGMRVEDGRILNPDDSSSPIVVGYRRGPDLAQHIDRRWGVPRDLSTGAGLRRAMRTFQTSFLGGALA
ncbi:hypothetical protein ACETK8_17195 [Brevundimonas staleyi]|uniref:Uncharacterized protein n=1 Tax=Brevundimonas staleyi TaxID=74326 RepID=A0ABW0FT85_9CAUL